MIPGLRIAKHLKEGVQPAYLLLGPDLYLRKLALEAFRALVDAGWRDLNLQNFTEKELEMCLESAQTLPMMSSHRLVILEDISKLKDEQWEPLYSYLENPNPRTVFVMVASKLHQARVRKITKNALEVSAAELNFGEARAMVEQSFKKEGYELEPGVAEELMDQVGTNLQDLRQQVEKLKLFRLQEKSVSLDDVHDLSNRSRTHVIWELVDLIATKDRKQLLTLLQRLFDEGAVPLVLLKSIYNHFSGLLAVKELAGRPESAIAKATGLKPYPVRKLVEQAHRFDMSDVIAALHELHRTDKALKGSALSDQLLMEILLVRIVGS